MALQEEMMAVAQECLEEVGPIVLQAIAQPKQALNKSSVIDLVTEWDKKVEKLILARIQKRFPKHHIVAEESHDGHYDISDEPTWFIDPIDGTNNFCHGIPMSCICIGASINRKPVIGVVHNPMLNETFTAVAGKGAFLNGVRIHVSSCSELNAAALATEFGYERSTEGVDIMISRLRKLLLKEVQSVRMFGSCALNMCSVAMGRIDVYFEGLSSTSGPKPWDFGAAQLILEEAGGLCLDIDGSEFDMKSGRILCASTRQLADQVVGILN